MDYSSDEYDSDKRFYERDPTFVDGPAVKKTVRKAAAPKAAKTTKATKATKASEEKKTTTKKAASSSSSSSSSSSAAAGTKKRSPSGPSSFAVDTYRLDPVLLAELTKGLPFVPPFKSSTDGKTQKKRDEINMSAVHPNELIVLINSYAAYRNKTDKNPIFKTSKDEMGMVMNDCQVPSRSKFMSNAALVSIGFPTGEIKNTKALAYIWNSPSKTPGGSRSNLKNKTLITKI